MEHDISGQNAVNGGGLQFDVNSIGIEQMTQNMTGMASEQFDIRNEIANGVFGENSAALFDASHVSSACFMNI